ncbi:hypothetical protein PHMEG_00040661, partial [Phytophthora megakarya]
MNIAMVLSITRAQYTHILFPNEYEEHPNIIGMVHKLVKAKSPFKRIYTYDDQLKRVERHLNEFVSNNPRNPSRIFVDDGDTARCLTLQTAGMRKTIDLFPEIVMVETTHKTNNLKSNLFGFMVHDTFGTGQFVQHEFVDAETKENMLNAVSIFKQNNEKWREVQVIMVSTEMKTNVGWIRHLILVMLDKDMNEFEVLEDDFPHARVLLCHFHVLKWFKTIKSMINRYF